MGLFRLVLAMSVVVSHFGNLFGLGFVGGGIAVRTFFLLSGFYMALVLHRKYLGMKNGLFVFYVNRSTRL